jgi:hypothetical protein
LSSFKIDRSDTQNVPGSHRPADIFACVNKRAASTSDLSFEFYHNPA